MIALITVVGWTVASVAFFWVVLRWCEAITFDGASASEILDSHYKGAQALLKDKTTPQSVVEFVVYFSERAGHASLARKFALHALFGGFIKRPKGTVSPKVQKFRDDLSNLNDAQKDAFSEMMAGGMISAAASDPIFSRLYLRFLMAFFSQSGEIDDKPSPERAKTAALDLSLDRRFACA